MITRYKKYLEFLDSKLKKMFDSQKPFVKCQKGCSYCCSEGEYPMSELEFIYLMMGFEALDTNTKEKVQFNIDKLLSKPAPKMYICPFLINNQCCVYPYRAIIRRTFGLISYNTKGNKKVPFCVDKGLNYADVFDSKTSKIVALAPDGTEPVAFNIDREYLTNKEFEKEFELFFGDDKTLYNWLKEEI
jgi:Fe-S-cluster containining protein